MLKKEIILGLLVVLLSFGLAGTSLASEGGEGNFTSLIDQMGNPVEVEATDSTAKSDVQKSDKPEQIYLKCAANTDDHVRNYGVDYCWDLFGS